jgi:hypothetical protein
MEWNELICYCVVMLYTKCRFIDLARCNVFHWENRKGSEMTTEKEKKFYHRRYRHFALAIGIAILFSAQLVSAQTRRTTRAASSNSRTASAPQNSQSSPKIVATGNLKKMGNEKIETLKGKKVSLKQVAQTAFQEQNKLVTSLRTQGVKQKALLKNPVVSDTVDDLGETYRLTQRTTFTVLNADSLKTATGGIDAGVSRQKRISVKSLSAEDKKMLMAVMADADKLDAKDPIRIAAAKGEQALLDAIRDGKGTMTIEETLIIPKKAIMIKNGYIQMPQITGGFMNFKKIVPVKAPFRASEMKKAMQKSAIVSQGSSAAQPNAAQSVNIPNVKMTNAPREIIGGEHDFKLELINGETYSTAYIWTKKWGVPTGFFRVTVGCTFTAGLRIPVVVEGKISPVTSDIAANRDKSTRVVTDITVDTIDAPAQYYASAGVPPEEIQDGKEFVFNLSVGYGYKLYVGGRDLLDKSYTSISVADFSQNNKMPFGDYSAASGLDLEIPPELTKTGFKLGILKGSVTFGLHVNGRGKFAMERRDILDGQYSTVKPMGFENTGKVSYTTVLPRMRESDRKSFGVEFSQFSYQLHSVEVVPQLKFVFGVNHSLVSFTRSSPWIRFYDLGIQTPNMSFRSHSGTQKRYHWEGGKKVFFKLDTSTDDSAKKVRRRRH